MPKRLRWIAATCLLPIPGPLDEAILLLIAPVFMIFHRAPTRDAWRTASGGASNRHEPDP